MNGRNLYSYLCIWLCISGLVTHSFAQTITTGSITPASVCPGGAVTISYTISGTFAAGNTFTAQLSDAAGSFVSPASIGNVTSTSAGSVNATIPSTATNSAAYRIRIVSGSIIGNAQALTVNVPSPPGVSPPSSGYCQNTTAAALVATPSAGGILNWYGTNATGGNPSAIAPLPNTATPGNFTYYVSQSVNNCESQRASIPVTVVFAANPPGTAPVNYCVGQSASALTANGENLKWYLTQTGGTALAAAPTPATNAVGFTTYYVSQVVAFSCESNRASLVVTVNAIPSAPNFTPPGSYCQNAQAAALIATPSAGGVLNWYGTNATGGTPSTVAPVPSTATPGTFTYYVSQSVNGCESSQRAAIPVTVNSTPAPSVIVPGGYCQNTSAAALVATPSAGGILNWYGTNATGGNPSAIAPLPNTATPGNFTYYVSQSVNNCESQRASIPVTVVFAANPPGTAPVNYCVGQSASALTANGENLKWYLTQTGGTALAAAPTPATNAVGFTTYYVSQVVAFSCESNRASLVVTVNAIPSVPAVAPPGGYCQNTSAVALVATPSAGGVLNWYGTNATGGTPSTNAPVPNTATPGTFTYYVSQSVNGCESSQRAAIPVIIIPIANPPGTANLNYCAGQTASALTATGENLKWYLTSSGGTALAAAPTPATNAANITTYYVSQLTANTCESNRASLVVTVNATPSAPGVGSVGICLNSPSFQLTASGTNLKWYDASNNPLGGAPTPGTGTAGDQVYKVSQTSSSGCESPKATLTVTIKPLPNAPGVVNRAFCLQTQDQPAQKVEALNAFGENLKWYNPDGTFTTIAPVPPISQTGVQTYSVSQTYNGCESPNKSTLLVTVGTSALPVAVKSLVTYCINDKAVPLEATGETGGSLRWIDPYGNITNVAPTPLTLNTSIQAGGDPFYVYQIGSNGCYSARTTIKALVNALPTLSLVPSATNINLGQRVALQLKFTSAAPFSYTLTNGLSTSGLMGVVNKSDTTLSLLPTSTSTYQIVTVKNSCGVGLPGNPATATITVRVPTITTSALTQSTACVGTSLTVPFSSTGTFNTGNLFRFELVSVADTSKKFSVPGTATASPVTAPLPLTLASGQYYVRVKADNPEIAIIGSDSPTPLTIRSLATATMAGTQKIYEGYPGSLTFTFGGDGPWTVMYADSVRSYSAVATTSPYPAEVRPTRTTTYRLTSVANGCGTGTISGTAVITVLPLLGVDDNSLDPLVKTYPVPTTSILTVELDLPLTRDPATLSLTTMSGRPVLQQTTRNKRHELDLTTQPSGLYLLHIQVGDRQTTRKVLKQ